LILMISSLMEELVKKRNFAEGDISNSYMNCIFLSYFFILILSNLMCLYMMDVSVQIVVICHCNCELLSGCKGTQLNMEFPNINSV